MLAAIMTAKANILNPSMRSMVWTSVAVVDPVDTTLRYTSSTHCTSDKPMAVRPAPWARRVERPARCTASRTPKQRERGDAVDEQRLDRAQRAVVGEVAGDLGVGRVGGGADAEGGEADDPGADVGEAGDLGPVAAGALGLGGSLECDGGGHWSLPSAWPSGIVVIAIKLRYLAKPVKGFGAGRIESWNVPPVGGLAVIAAAGASSSSAAPGGTNRRSTDGRVDVGGYTVRVYETGAGPRS